MRLLTFAGPNGELQLGVLQPGGVVDLATAAAALGLPPSDVEPMKNIALGETDCVFR